MKSYFFILITTISLTVPGQDQKKFDRYLTVSAQNGVNLSQPIFIDRQNPDKHGWEEFANYFKQSFVNHDFVIVEEKSEASYLLVIDYKYIYKIARYTMQYSNLYGNIVDNDTKTSVGSFEYDGNFDIDAIGNGVAVRLGKYKLGKEVLQKEMKAKPGKTKKERLQELKALFEEGLISKENYEQEQRNILNEK